MGTPVPGEGRWGRAVLLAVLVQAGLLVLGLSVVPARRVEAPVPPEPELVFLTLGPPPAAPARDAGASEPPQRAQRQARSRPARPVERGLSTPNPVLPPVEPAPVPPVEAVGAASAAPAEQGGVGAVISGVVGGVLGGMGAPGGTDEAVGLKQVLRAPEVLKQRIPETAERLRTDVPAMLFLADPEGYGCTADCGALGITLPESDAPRVVLLPSAAGSVPQ
ncbi:MAG TPA: hypothetical protein VE153_36070 [Myxococcus sp.]|nr:hypothetical protein [Myxococcus sp.]